MVAAARYTPCSGRKSTPYVCTVCRCSLRHSKYTSEDTAPTSAASAAATYSGSPSAAATRSPNDATPPLLLLPANARPNPSHSRGAVMDGGMEGMVTLLAAAVGDTGKAALMPRARSPSRMPSFVYHAAQVRIRDAGSYDDAMVPPGDTVPSPSPLAEAGGEVLGAAAVGAAPCSSADTAARRAVTMPSAAARAAAANRNGAKLAPS